MKPNHAPLTICVTSAAALLLLSLGGCGVSAESGTSTQEHSSARTIPAVIGGETFHLELAADPLSHDLGLGGRKSIPIHGGMVFVFSTSDYQGFTMRNCTVPIDLIYLDQTGLILYTASMQPESPQTLEETDEAYNARLRIYLSPVPTRLAIELRGGTVSRLALQPGDTIMLDHKQLFPH